MANDFMRERLMAETQIDRLICEFNAGGNADKLDLLHQHLSRFIALEGLDPLRSELLQICMRTRTFAARCGWSAPVIAVRAPLGAVKSASPFRGAGAPSTGHNRGYAKIAAAPSV